MGSRRIPLSPPNPPQPPPGTVMSHYHNFNAAGIMGPTATSQSFQQQRPQFASLAPRQQQQQQQHHPQQPQPPQALHHQQQQQQMDQKTLESLGFSDGSPSSQPTRFGIEQNQSQNQQQQQLQRKRGRPRKYTPDNNIALGLAPTSPLISAAGGGDGGVGDSGGGGGGNADSDDPPAKRRGRPPGSGKKQLGALALSAGFGFTPHVIEVNTGEDIASKVIAFCNHGPRTICILSAFGGVSRVTLKQASIPSGTVTYEGRYEIITLSGSFVNYEVNGSTNRRSSLSVALAGDDGRILGGGVVGPLVAATQAQVIVGSFVTTDAKKPEQSSGNNAQGQNPEPASAAANMLNFGSVSQGPSSESSEGNEGSSPSMQRDSNNENYGAQQQQQQPPLHPHQMLWPNRGR